MCDGNKELDKKNELKETVVDYIFRLCSNIPELIDRYRNLELGERTAEDLIDFIEGIQWLVECLAVLFGEKEQIHQKIIPFLTEFAEAMQNKDYFLIADILEYEFLPLAESLKAEAEKIGVQ